MKLSTENPEFKSGFDTKWQAHVEKKLQTETLNTVNDTLDKTLSKIKIVEAINDLKNGKSPGIDQISAELLKRCATNKSFIELLYILFNKLYDDGIFPSSWAEGVIIPIFKKVNSMIQTITGALPFLASWGKCLQ